MLIISLKYSKVDCLFFSKRLRLVEQKNSLLLEEMKALTLQILKNSWMSICQE